MRRSRTPASGAKHCSPSYGLRKFFLYQGNRFGDETKAAMKEACEGEGEAAMIVLSHVRVPRELGLDERELWLKLC